MAENLKGKYFVASRGFYGTNSVTYKGIEIEVTKYNHDYSNPITSFDWGNTEKGANLLAFVILNIIASPTIARVYANKYMKDVIERFQEDEWRMEAIEVARWINKNTNYIVEIDEDDELKAKEDEAKRKKEEAAKEARRIKREEEFKKQVQKKLAKRAKNDEKAKKEAHKILTNNVVDNLCKELRIKHETLAKILDINMDTINNWRLENEMPKMAKKAMEFYKAGVSFKEKNSQLKAERDNLQEQLNKKETEMTLFETDLNNYKKFITSLDIPKLYKKFKEL
jgi:DNA-binding transcriptional regulator YiaG